jgi:hypothetical protein
MADITSKRPLYVHRQIGWFMLLWAWVPIAALAAIWFFTPLSQRVLPPFLLPVIALFVTLAIASFSSMLVVVTSTHIVMRFGLGLLKRTVALERIASTAIVKTRWYDGWGIHWTTRGTLYNVSGFDAVRVVLDDGKAIIIGSDEPERLHVTLVRVLHDRSARNRR